MERTRLDRPVGYLGQPGGRLDGSGRPTRDRTEPGKVRQEAKAAQWTMTSLGLSNAHVAAKLLSRDGPSNPTQRTWDVADTPRSIAFTIFPLRALPMPLAMSRLGRVSAVASSNVRSGVGPKPNRRN